MARPERARVGPGRSLMSKMLQSWRLTPIGSLCRSAAPVKGSGGVEVRGGLKSPVESHFACMSKDRTNARSFAVFLSSLNVQGLRKGNLGLKCSAGTSWGGFEAELLSTTGRMR
jgi:hypothetical protein